MFAVSFFSNIASDNTGPAPNSYVTLVDKIEDLNTEDQNSGSDYGPSIPDPPPETVATAPVPIEKPITNICTYNVWYKTKAQDTVNEIASLLSQHDCDFLVLQEFTDPNKIKGVIDQIIAPSIGQYSGSMLLEAQPQPNIETAVLWDTSRFDISNT